MQSLVGQETDRNTCFRECGITGAVGRFNRKPLERWVTKNRRMA